MIRASTDIPMTRRFQDLKIEDYRRSGHPRSWILSPEMV